MKITRIGVDALAADKAAPEGPEPTQVTGIGLDVFALGDEQMQLVVDKLQRVLGTDIPVLIEGESGTGKERLALAIHHNGPRRNGPFVTVNCEVASENLIESALFGADGGGFANASRPESIGGIRQAQGGTLFLDEIGDMPLAVQARLLPVLQEPAGTPLGSSRSLRLNMALICATSRKIRELVAGGEFREDLYYRVNGLTVILPPLRARSDLKPMVFKLVDLENKRGVPVQISAEVLDIFARHPWPGNIRQLHNVIRTALALLGEGPELTRECLPDDFLDELGETREQGAAQSSAVPAATTQEAAAAAAGDSLEDIETRAIRLALENHRGNLSAAARQLGVGRNTLYRKLRKSQELWARLVSAQRKTPVR